MIDEPRTFTLDELSGLAGIPRRTVRFYIQQGLVDRPEGASRRAAYYTRHHLEQLLTVRRWQDSGLSLERIREILHEQEDGSLPPIRPRRAGTVEVWSHIIIYGGVELHIEPGQAGLSPEQIRGFFKKVVEAFHTIKERESNGGKEPQ